MRFAIIDREANFEDSVFPDLAKSETATPPSRRHPSLLFQYVDSYGAPDLFQPIQRIGERRR
jgi:hypothetical protein